MTEAWIVETQTKLGGVITAPKLTDKLLSKPPFRFLHDVAMAFMKATNLLDGLFTDIELNPGREADKDVKMSFLQKLITVVSIANDTQCAAKASKIIAGAEPEATNQMLVLLANLKDMPKSKVDKAVKATLSGGEAEAAPAAAPAARPAPAQEAPPPPAAAATSERPQSQGGGRRPAPGATGAAPAPAAAAQPSSVPQVNALPNQTSDSSAPQRPMSARSGKPPPTVKESTQVVDSSEPVTKAHQANVITEAKGQDEEEGQKGDQDWLQLVEQNEAKAAQGGSVEGGNARGYLAAQAAQAKKEQEDAKKKAEADAAAAGQSTGGVVIKTRKKDDKGAGSIGTSEMSKLREQLQLLTKASNPLGKFLEALHEDIDTMARELEMWRTEARTQTVAAADARRQTEEALRELQAKQQALEDALTEKNAQISIVRGTIQQNDKTIETLIRMVVTPDAAAKK